MLLSLKEILQKLVRSTMNHLIRISLFNMYTSFNSNNSLWLIHFLSLRFQAYSKTFYGSNYCGPIWFNHLVITFRYINMSFYFFSIKLQLMVQRNVNIDSMDATFLLSNKLEQTRDIMNLPKNYRNFDHIFSSSYDYESSQHL